MKAKPSDTFSLAVLYQNQYIMENIEQLLTSIVQSFVTTPDDVCLTVSEESDDKGDLVMIHVKVNKQDVGMCIGEKGITAEAIRRVVGLAGFRQLNKRVFVKIDAPRLFKSSVE